MNKIIILSAILAGLAGCSSSSSDDTSTGVSATVTTAQLVGTWLLACEEEFDDSGFSIGSFEGAVLLTASTGVVTVFEYSDANCQVDRQALSPNTFSYTLGPDFTLDGTVAGITTGTEFNEEDTTIGSIDFGEKTYSSIALVGNSLYVGDDEADPLKDATAPDKRPTKLDDVPLIKQ